MVNARIDTTRGLDGELVVLACLDLSQEDVAAAAHAVRATAVERFRIASMSVDDVLELRELTALADELAEPTLEPAMRRFVWRAARLSVCLVALTRFVETCEQAEWIREEDREPLRRVRGLVPALGDLSAEVLRAALSPPATRPC